MLGFGGVGVDGVGLHGEAGKGEDFPRGLDICLLLMWS
jgi:hypothetical protein